MEVNSQLHVVDVIIADNHQLLTEKKCITMKRKDFPYKHTQIVEWLKQSVIRRNEGKEYRIYEYLEEIPEILKKIEEVKKDFRFSIDPNLPIDLIYVEKRKEETKKGRQDEFSYYTIFLVISTNTIPDSLESRIMFYKFYFSRIISSKRLGIVLVTPDYTRKINEKFLRDNGVGFWKFVSKGKDPQEVFPPISLRDLMAKEFQKSNPKDIPLFFDKYVHDAVNAIAGVKSEQFGKRHIDRKIIDKLFDLKKISYREELFSVMNEHLTEKGNEYEFAFEVFSKLWEKCIGIYYSNFLKIFDPVLQHIFAETEEESIRIYRDHYLHQFQVFLLGLYFIDKLYHNFTEKYKKPEISWLIISSFHDMAYPVQLYDDWSGEFFKKIFDVTKDIAHIELKSKFVEESFMNCTNSLIASLCSVFGKEELKGDWLAEKNKLVQFFYKEITEAKNHCILSSISLLKMIPKYKTKIMKTIKSNGDRKKFQDIFNNIFMPSALAIALHDAKIWLKLKKDGNLPILKFEDDPLSFLLIFCDNIQEWGRPLQLQINDEGKRWKRFYLKDLKYDPKRGFDITIWTPNHTKAERFFKDKKTELGEIETFLQQPSSVKFAIRLEDKNHKGEDFEMEGSSF